MKSLNWMLFETVALLAGCGSDIGTDDPVPNPMVLGDVCAAQHTDGDLVVCDELYAEAPFVHLPASTSTRAFAAIEGLPEGSRFVTPEGTTYPHSGTGMGSDPEMYRHATTLYELTLEGGSLKSFRPVVTFPESMFVAPFMGKSFEGTISRMTGEGQWADEASLPVRIEITDPVDSPTNDSAYQARVVIKNLDTAVTAADGSCMPALSSYGAEAPIPAGEALDLRVGRVPSMHGFFDDQFVFTFVGEGTLRGTLMGSGWFRAPVDLLRGSLAASGTYSGVGHGSPGSMPSLELDLADAGGEPCTP